MAVHPGSTRKPRSCTCRTKVLMQCPAKVAHHIRAQVEVGMVEGGCLMVCRVCVCVRESVCVCLFFKRGEAKGVRQ